MYRTLMAAMFTALLTVSGAVAHDEAGTPAANTGNGLVYLTITNTGAETDTLVSASTDAAGRVTMHKSMMMGEMMHMEEEPGGFAIEPGTPLVLEQGGSHLMLENLRRDLRIGDTFEVTLRFERAGDVTIPVAVGVEAPEGDPIRAGDLELSPAWSLPAPMLGDATPESTPEEHHHG